MNQENFDLLMQGKDAKWADANMLDSLKVENPYAELKDNTIELSLIRAEINNKQKPIPFYVSDAIHKFVKGEREKGESERSIRRAVKRKWNIFVV